MCQFIVSSIKFTDIYQLLVADNSTMQNSGCYFSSVSSNTCNSTTTYVHNFLGRE